MSRVKVDPVVVVYALRYALPRVSGALSDVVPAVIAAWPHMDAGLRQAVRRDLEDWWRDRPFLDTFSRPAIQTVRDLLDFTDRQETP